jgi:hypothetical protein
MERRATELALMIDRSRIGFTTEPSSALVDAWRVKLFCQATGETDSAVWAPDAPVPPTFLKAIENEHFASARLMQLLNVPLKSILHAEQSFEHIASVFAGDSVEVQRTVRDIYDKKGGAMTFIAVDTSYRIGERAVATSRQLILVRNQPGDR